MIRIHTLAKQFPLENSPLFENINLQIPTASSLLIQGSSGIGKTTLLNLIAAFEKPTQGEIIVDGVRISHLNDYHASQYRKKRICYITQKHPLLDALSVEENLLLALYHHTHFSFQEKLQRIEEILKTLELQTKQHTRTILLSGGERQRVIIARALLKGGDIILCDEPTSHLDTHNKNIFLSLLQTLKSEGKTIILVSHDTLLQSHPFFDAEYVLTPKSTTL